MTKRYHILRKKLAELETRLSQLLALAPETPHSHLLSDDVDQRFVFLKNLLSAEIASGPSKPHHLGHIHRHVNDLYSAFRQWDAGVNGGAPGGQPEDLVDAKSTCSCTESCLNDDGECCPDSDLPGWNDPEEFYEPNTGSPGREGPREVFYETVEEKAPLVELYSVGERGKNMKSGDGKSCSWKYCAAVFGAAVLAAAGGFAVARFYGCFHYTEPGGYLIPT
ncbi:hypothetical protein NMG60_11012242 [Bertholletia excelsa]